MSSAGSPNNTPGRRKGKKNLPPPLPAWVVVIGTVFALDHLSITGPLGLMLQK